MAKTWSLSSKPPLARGWAQQNTNHCTHMISALIVGNPAGLGSLESQLVGKGVLGMGSKKGSGAFQGWCLLKTIKDKVWRGIPGKGNCRNKDIRGMTTSCHYIKQLHWARAFRGSDRRRGRRQQVMKSQDIRPRFCPMCFIIPQHACFTVTETSKRLGQITQSQFKLLFRLGILDVCSHSNRESLVIACKEHS